MKCTWLHGFTSHLKVHTCTRQGTVVAGLTAARQVSSDTTLSLPWTNWTHDTALRATPRSQDTEQGDVLNTLHLDKWQWLLSHFAFGKKRVFLIWCDVPRWAAVGVTWNHCCGFWKVSALRVLHHLLLPLCFSSTVQHPVGHPSSTRYTADSLLRVPPGVRKGIWLLLFANPYFKTSFLFKCIPC